MTDASAMPVGLDALEARLAQDLAWLELPAKPWVPPKEVDGQRVRDVVIVGAGMAGLVAAGMLKRLGVDNQILFDRASAGSEGPWITSARMRTLRSPKQLTGPAMGLPALTFRAYYEARFGHEAWDALDRAPRALWMEYLVWYRRALELPVENEVEVAAIEPRPDGMLALRIVRNGIEETVYARHVVLATGRDGLGGSYVPPIVRTIDRRFWAHTADAIDFNALRGKRVAVVGAGASSMDNAAVALETGCERLDLFVRRSDIPRVNKFTGIGSQGVIHGFAGLPDDWKWRFLHHTLQAQTPPPRPSTLRVSQHANAHFHLGSPVLRLEVSGDGVVITTPRGRHKADFIIFGTGFRVDLAARPELAAIAPHVRFWRDRFAVPADMPDPELESSPDLGESFEFQERTPGRVPHCGKSTASTSRRR